MPEADTEDILALAAVEQLITAYPAWTKVEDLPADHLEERMKVVADLWEKGVLKTSQPLRVALVLVTSHSIFIQLIFTQLHPFRRHAAPSCEEAGLHYGRGGDPRVHHQHA
jgi:hypothetical protein